MLVALVLFAASPHPPAENAVGLHAVYPFPRLGVAASYERVFARFATLDVQFEHMISARGFTHLPGFEESVGVGLWPWGAGKGLYVEPTASLAHNLFYRIPRMARHAARLGAEMGGRLPVGARVWVGAGLGARYGWKLGGSAGICTYAYQCASTRSGALVRGRVSMGVRW